MITSPKAREAFDVNRERRRCARSASMRFGTSCLLAVRPGRGWGAIRHREFRRLGHTCQQLPPVQGQPAAATRPGTGGAVEHAGGEGLLETTAVCVTGEFGRTPKVNARSGRDHWPRAMCVLFAGGGVRGGQVIGASDAQGMGPTEEAITPDQAAASFYHSLGIDHRKEYHTATGRPVMIVRDGSVIPSLFGG
jgi:hypothetical protein